MMHSSTVARYLQWLASGHSPATVTSYKYGFYALEKWLALENKQIETCSLEDITQFVQSLETMELKDKTRAHYVTCLRSLWKWLDRQALVPFKHDLIPMPIVLDTERRPYLSEDEFARIMGYFDEYFPIELRNKTIVAFLFATGLRLGEMMEIDMDSLDMEERKVNVRTFKRRNHHRDVYWDDETHRLLVKWIDVRAKMLSKFSSASPALFISFNSVDPGKRIERHAVQHIFRNVRSDLKIDKPLSPHSCRHGFATKGVKNEVNIFYLKEMMGHANIQNTMVYTHSDRKDLQAEYKKVFARKAS